MHEIVGDFSRIRHHLSWMNRTVYIHAHWLYLFDLFDDDQYLADYDGHKHPNPVQEEVIEF